MAKRFTDSTLSRKPWYRKLPCRLKCAIRFTWDECDHAGIWTIDLDALEFYVGEAVSLSELLDSWNSGGKTRCKVIDGRIFLPVFVQVQYPVFKNCKPHISVKTRLQKLRLWKEYRRGYLTFQDTDKDTDKDSEEGVGGDVESNPGNFDLESLADTYPVPSGRGSAIKELEKHIQTPQDYADFKRAVPAYVRDRERQKIALRNFKNFIGTLENPEWRNWVPKRKPDPRRDTIEPVIENRSFTPEQIANMRATALGREEASA